MNQEKYKDYLNKIKKGTISLSLIPSSYLSEEICFAAVKRNPSSIDQVPPNFQTEKICLYAAKNYVWAMKHISKPSKKVCFAALDYNPNSLEKIKNPTPEMDMFVIRKNTLFLVLIPKERQTPEMCLEVIQKNPTDYKLVLLCKGMNLEDGKKHLEHIVSEKKRLKDNKTKLKKKLGQLR